MMRLPTQILRAIGRPFAQAWRWALRRVPKTPDAPAGAFTRAKYNVGFARTLAAPRWRTLVRWSVVAVGFSVYIGMQLVLAYLCNQLMWWFIVGFFIIVACLAFAVARPAQTFVVWLVLSPVGFLFLRLDFGESMPAITFDRVALVALAGYLIIRAMIERHLPKRPIVAEWLTMAFLGYTAVSLYVMHPGSLRAILGTISERFDHIGLAVIAYYIAKSVLVSRKQLTWAVVGLAMTGLSVAGSAFYEHYTGDMWFNSFLPGNYSLFYADVGRAAGPLLNPAAMGTFLGITAFLSFHLAGSAQHRAMRVFYNVATVLQLIGCYFCFTRSGYVAALLLFVLMPVFSKFYRRRYVALVVAVGVVSIVAGPFVLSNRMIENRLTQERTILYRVAITASTINVIKHHPLFGVGLGEIDHAIEQYITNAGTMSGIYARGMTPNLVYPQQKLAHTITSHNSILTIFAEQGCVGGLLYVGALGVFIFHLIRIRARLPDKGTLGKDFVAFLIVAAIGHIISIMGYDIRFFKYPNYVLWVIFAIGIRLGEIAAEEARSRVAEEIVIPEPNAGALVHA